MARNPKQDANLKPYKKGELSSEEAKKRGSEGGKKSGEVRRAKRDARQAARYILNLAAKGNTLYNLEQIGAEEEDGLTNMEALQARLYTSALAGNLDAAKMLLAIAGYDPEENRAERESKAADRRRDLEVQAKVEAIGNSPENAGIALNMGDEDGHNDVVIYVPQMLSEEDCMAPDEGDESSTTEDETEKE